MIFKEIAKAIGDTLFVDLYRKIYEKLGIKARSPILRMISKIHIQDEIFYKFHEICKMEKLAVALTMMGNPYARPLAWRWLTGALTVGETSEGIGKHRIGKSIDDTDVIPLIRSLFDTIRALKGYSGICLMLDEVDTIAKVSESKRRTLQKFFFDLIRENIPGLFVVLGCTDEAWEKGFRDPYSESIGLKRRIEGTEITLTGEIDLQVAKELFTRISSIYKNLYHCEFDYFTDDRIYQLMGHPTQPIGYLVPLITKTLDNFLPIAILIKQVREDFDKFNSIKKGYLFQQSCYNLFSNTEKYILEGPFPSPDFIIIPINKPTVRIAVECKYTDKVGKKLSKRDVLDLIGSKPKCAATHGVLIAYGFSDIPADLKSTLHKNNCYEVLFEQEKILNLLLTIGLTHLPIDEKKYLTEYILNFLNFNQVLSQLKII